MPSKLWHRSLRARRRKRRRRRSQPREHTMEYLVHHLLTNVLGPQLLPRAPWDPYARGNVVPPRKTVQKRSAEQYEVASGGGKPLWADRAYNPDFGNMTGLVRTMVPIWSDALPANARRPEYRPKT